VWKKSLVVLLGFVVVVGLTSAIYLWIDRTGNGVGDVEWSPLYTSRERTALAPVTSQVAYGAMQSAAKECDTYEYQTCSTCGDQYTCDTCQTCGGWTCDRTCDTCQGPTCGETCQETCATCDGWTCEGTCDAATCQETCATCDGYTCEGTCGAPTCRETCATCDGWTCEETCDEGSTCDTTCKETCNGTHTCEDTCEGGWTCDGWTCAGSTCEEGGTCDGATCPAPTCSGRTCVGPTCAGFRTCAGTPTCDTTCDSECEEPTWDLRTCEGPTCDGPSCGDRTCDPWECDFPTFEDLTCERPTCDGPTCEGSTCEGGTCLAAECGIWDFGDAPDRTVLVARNYLTRLEDDGARHRVDGVRYLGRRVDEEPDGQPNDVAYGDDIQPWSVDDDEDGVWFPVSLIPGQQAILIVDASEEGFFHGWIDYDEDGNWQAEEERLFSPALLLPKGFNWIAFDLPENAKAPDTSYARFRFGTEEVLGYGGEARNGEVEDYYTALCPVYDVWIMTDDIVYQPGEEVLLTFYVNSVSQIEIVRHRSDGTASLLWAGTVEAGQHEIRDFGGSLRALPPEGTSTVEMLATSVETGCSTWVTTPFVVEE
jgi:hypothetical protein